MHIGIFAERFIGRYGADRVLVIIADFLKQAGHQVTLVGWRFGPAVQERYEGHTFRIPDLAGKAPEGQTLKWLRDRHYYLQRRLPRFDVCIVGGYPFHLCIPFLREISPRVYYVDFGVVPNFGYAPNIAQVLDMLRAHRRETLPQTTGIVAISDYVAREQSRPDSQDKAPVHTILLGADHVAKQLGTTEEIACIDRDRGKSVTRAVMDEVCDKDYRLILALGRWEPGCYKNSQAALNVMASLADLRSDIALLILAHPSYTHIDTKLFKHVYCLGFPTDAELGEVIRHVDAGISVSLWEGFNLPVVELQQEDKHVYAFNLGAHPEVVVAQEQLCADADDMAHKLFNALGTSRGKPAWAGSAAQAAWQEKFTWQRFMDDFTKVVEDAA